jgi:hypothetical protein
MAYFVANSNGTYGDHYDVYIYYTLNSQNLSSGSPNITSNITLDLYTRSDSTSYYAYNLNSSAATWNIQVNDITRATGSSSYDHRNRAWVHWGSWTGNVTHNGDGSLTIKIEGNHSATGTGLSGGSVSGNWTLPTVARPSEPSTPDSSIYFGSALTINTNPASTNYTHTLKYSFGSSSGTIATGVKSTYDWTLPTSLANQIPNATYGAGTITCETYSGSIHVGSKTMAFTGHITSSMKPSFSSISHSDNNSTVSSKVGSYVQGLSRLNIYLNGVGGSYGSTIKSYSVNFDGSSWSHGTSITTGTIKGSGNLTISATVTDSRGQSTTKTATVNVLAYSLPKITSAQVYRIHSSTEDPDPLGTLVQVKLSGSYTSLGGVNTTKAWGYYREKGSGAAWSDAMYGYISLPSTSFNITQNTDTGSFEFNITKSYEFRFVIEDQFNSSVLLTNLSTGQVTMSWGRTGVGVGKVWESGALDVSGDVIVNNGLTRSRFGSERIPSGADLNSYTTPGFYHCPLNADAGNISNTPTNQAFSLLVEDHAGTKQTFTTYVTTNQRSWVRNRYSTSWGDWKPVSTIDGWGTNSNGTWIRYSTGLQICWWNDIPVTNFSIPTQYGLLYQGTWRWTYPAAFSEDPTVQASKVQWGTSASWGTIASLNGTHADIRAIDNYSRSSGTDVHMTLLAIGWWF